MPHKNPNSLVFEVNSPLGILAIHTQENAIVKLDFPVTKIKNTTPACDKTVAELTAYFQNAKHKINMPVTLQGTSFQQRVWRALCNIPAGKTMTYGELAKQLKTSARAVGQACKKNPVPIIVPCHRIVGANHQGGYMGKTTGNSADIKAWLLLHEKQVAIK